MEPPEYAPATDALSGFKPESTATCELETELLPCERPFEAAPCKRSEMARLYPDGGEMPLLAFQSRSQNNSTSELRRTSEVWGRASE